MPPVSIIIPALNEQYYLPRLLDSLTAQRYDGQFEIILVDGGSTDKTLEVARRYSETLPNLRMYTTHKGISHQRNFGAAKAKYDVLIFLDADAELPTPTTLSRIAMKCRGLENFVAIPHLFPYNGKLIDYPLQIAAYVYFTFVRRKAPIVSGMCMITTKVNHEWIKGFNEKAIFAEDVDYGLRSVKNGAKYRIFFTILVRASARRLDEMGRFRVGLAWRHGYRETVKHGPITDKKAYTYDFGHWGKRR